MTDPVYRKLDYVGTSTSTIEAAVANAVACASAASPGEAVDWFEIIETRGAVRDGKVQQYQVVIKVGIRCKT
ncbi:MAG: dodecin [Rhodospirillaceae bacterium]